MNDVDANRHADDGGAAALSGHVGSDAWRDRERAPGDDAAGHGKDRGERAMDADEIASVADTSGKRRATRSGARLTDRQISTFFDTLASTGKVRASAKAARASCATLYGRRRIDRAFAEAWEAAKAIAYERLEEAMLGYAIAKFAVDPDAAPAEAGDDDLAGRVASPAVSRADLDLAIAVLARGVKPVAGRRRGATAEESDAVIRRKLQAYAQKLIDK
jgi:hypothetical protein